METLEREWLQRLGLYHALKRRRPGAPGKGREGHPNSFMFCSEIWGERKRGRIADTGK